MKNPLDLDDSGKVDSTDAKQAASKAWAWSQTHTTISVGILCLVLGRLGFPWIV